MSSRRDLDPRNRNFPTIACLGGPMVSEQSQQAGVIERARNRGATLFMLSGSMLESPHGFEVQRSVIFDLVDLDQVDGLIFNSDYLGHYVGPERIDAFLRRYQPLPIVNNGAPIPGVPTLVVDFYQGMHDLVTHLIEIHHYEQIAFLRGSEKSFSGNERYRAYQDALSQHGIPLDENLVAPGTFYPPSGQKAVQLFLDQRGLRPGRNIQALASANDQMALDAMQALQDRGFRIPEDIAVVGFDDDEEACSAYPPLTTARLPTFETGEWQVDTILAMIRGEYVPEITSMPAVLIVRQSCGCVNPMIRGAAAGQEKREDEAAFLEEVSPGREDILIEMRKAAGSQFPGRDQGELAAFLDLVMEELSGKPERLSSPDLVKKLEEFFNGVRNLYRNTFAWHGALSAMRREILPGLQDALQRTRFEDLCQQARALIGDIAQSTLVRLMNQGTYLDKLLHEINQEMATAVNGGELMDILARDLPMLGIQGCYLSFYEDPEAPASWSRLRLAYQGKERLDPMPDGLRFPSKQLVPRDLLDVEQQHILVGQSLYFQKEQIGFVCFEAGPSHGPLYEALREQISSTLKRIQLHQAAEKARRQAEDADRLKSRFLSMVSHELRTPLSMIISLSELLIEEQEGVRGGLAQPFQHELEVIHATGQHLDRLLRDVLDLGRSQMGQLKLEYEPVDLAGVVKEAAAVGEELAREKGLQWVLSMPPSLPWVWGDRTRLRQVLLNLISNACKFTNRGEVGLEVRSEAEKITILVRDTGLGVPPEEQETIFDEFRQSERTTARGYGGMGLGLAITRRLVEMHGGTIRVQSDGQEGSGATFTFTMPGLGYGPAAEMGMAPAAGWEGAVLILTGRKGGSRFLRQSLEGRGFVVAELDIHSAGDWPAKIQSAAPGAVVLDCDPSTEWGILLLKTLKENPATRDLPVLFACLSPQEDCGAVLELDFLAKPLGSNALAQALEARGLGREKRPGKPKTILVVDDEPAVLELHARRLREQLPGGRVLEARNGRQAMEIMGEVRPDLVLLDLMMPELDGFGVLEKMHSMESTRDIPVIVLTAQTLTEEVIERLNRGVAAILGKGIFCREELLAQVEAALGRSKRLGSQAQRIARRTMAYLHTHYPEPVSRQEIAHALGVNERYLTRCFREETGITPMEYLSRYRVKQAQKSLEEGQKSITEVALEAGFSSSAYFSRVFRQETGLTPHEYRQGKRGPLE